MIGKLDETLQFNASALKLRADRQQLIAANIANADTPGFKAVDFDFRKALDAATKGGPAGAPHLAASSAGHIAGKSTSTSAVLAFRTPSQASIDGNSVEMDAERAQFADNAVRYEAALKFLNGQIKTILSAIQG